MGRHTFVAWGLRIDAHRDRMAELAGHSSGQVIDEGHGMTQRGLENVPEEIRRLFGEDVRQASPLTSRRHPREWE